MVTDPYLSLELLEGEVLTPVKVCQNFLWLQQSRGIPSIITIHNHMYVATVTWKLPPLA